MVEVSNGTIQVAGRDLEQTTVVILGENALIERELSKSMVERYDEGDDYVRSIVERVAISYDDDGNKVVTPVGSPDAEPVGTLSDDEASARVTAAETAKSEAEGRVRALEEQVNTLQSELDTAKQEAERLSADLTEANDQLGTAISYADLSPEAVEAEAKARGVEPEKGSGKNDAVVKADRVAALEGASSSS
jgi:Tfp pilus assembly protein FimV